MSPGDAARVLAYCMMFDGREMPKDPEMAKEFVMAWYSVIGDLDLPDALEAVRRHYMISSKWAMPVNVRDGAAQIRRERRAALPPHEIRSLPSRFEKDVDKAARVQRGIGPARSALEKVFEAMAKKNGSPAALSALEELKEITEGSGTKTDDDEEGRVRD